MISVIIMLRVVVVGSILLLSPRSVVAQLATCENAKALGLAQLSRTQQGCAMDLSQCQVDNSCDDCLAGADSYTAVCYDGCSYTWGDYSVTQTTTGSVGVGYFDIFTPIPILIQSYHISFSGDGAPDGSFSVLYDAWLNDDGSTQPALGATCTAEFNDNECLCEQRWCDSAEESYGFFFDCSALEGGSEIDDCIVPELTAESSLFEILLGTLYLACTDESPPESSEANSTTSSEGATLNPRDQSAASSPDEWFLLGLASFSFILGYSEELTFFLTHAK